MGHGPPRRKKVGVLDGRSFDTPVRRAWGDAILAEGSPTTTFEAQDVVRLRLDRELLGFGDTCRAEWFLGRYPDDVAWNEEGHNFSWRMKLRNKQGHYTLRVVDKHTGESWTVNPRTQLGDRQHRKSNGRPDMLLQYVHYLRDAYGPAHLELLVERGAGAGVQQARGPVALQHPLGAERGLDLTHPRQADEQVVVVHRLALAERVETAALVAPQKGERFFFGCKNNSDHRTLRGDVGKNGAPK